MNVKVPDKPSSSDRKELPTPKGDGDPLRYEDDVALEGGGKTEHSVTSVTCKRKKMIRMQMLTIVKTSARRKSTDRLRSPEKN